RISLYAEDQKTNNPQVTTIAGSPSGSASSGSTNATGTAARFKNPTGITSDGTNLYVVEQENHTIRKIVISTGAVTTFAGSPGSYGSTNGTGTSARFKNPLGITTDGTNLYVTDQHNHTIRKIVISTGAVTTLAGYAGSSGSTDGTGTSARFKHPFGITKIGTNLYVTDANNHRIRKIVIATGVVSTLAGSSSGYTDATGTSAKFNAPTGITTDGTDLYVADSNNHKIRKIVISTGVVTTLAGSSSGHTDATGTSASFKNPSGMTTDGTNLYVADRNNHKIRKIVISTGVVSTLAGSSSGSTDGTGTSASFNQPLEVTTDGTNLYVADYANHKIRKINLRGTVTADVAMHNLDDDTNVTVNLASSDTGEATVAPATLTFTENNWNTAQTVTLTGVNDNVRDRNQDYKISLSAAEQDPDNSEVTTFAGSGTAGSTNGTGTAATFKYPNEITTDGTNLYVAEPDNHKIRKIVISTGVVTTLAGSGSSGFVNATGTAARFNQPKAVATDGTNVYVVDTNNHRIRKVVISTGVVTTFAGSGSNGSADGTGTSATFNSPEAITTDGTNLYVTDTSNHKIRKIVISTGVVTTLAGSSAGSTDATGTAARFSYPRGITTDGANLYVSDHNNHKIRKIVISTGVVSTLAGSGSAGSANGTGTAASFSQPRGITTDGTNLYVVDHANHTIRKIVISTGVVTTLSGSAGTSGSTDGTATGARFKNPRGITIEGKNLYVGGYGNHKIRKISLLGTATADVAMHNLDDDTDITVKLESSDTGEATVSPATLTFT
ncbi:hypothetical protein OAK48_04920, partial [Deltaproteobacteria bacterium]|nr:hypothetical protein [Deltaproteobacteria bacterium]